MCKFGCHYIYLLVNSLGGVGWGGSGGSNKRMDPNLGRIFLALEDFLENILPPTPPLPPPPPTLPTPPLYV